MIRIPRSISGPAAEFNAAVNAHRKALATHTMGRPGKPVPVHNELIESLIQRVPQDGPVATRGPDQFVILPYEIFDDTPVDPKIQLLRDSVKGHIITGGVVRP